MLPDYFVVGPTLALCTRSRLPAGSAPAPLPWSLSILRPPRQELGVVWPSQVAGGLAFQLAWSAEAALDVALMTEAARLTAGIGHKLTGAGLWLVGAEAVDLSEHGFTRTAAGAWQSVGARPTPSGKVETMEQLYADPFEVVWNFEPRQWQILGPFVAGVESGRRVLDIGCGYGKNAVLLEELGYDVHGIDVARSAVALCRRWVGRPGQFLAASLESLPHDAESFDAILDIGCLHCLTPELAEAAIDELVRVLRPGAALFSRFLKPRGRAWLDAQRFRVGALGMTPHALLRWLGPRFHLTLVEEAEMILVHGTRRSGR